jgi:phosphatidylinositol alpha-1,6-mannosyltransferase
VLRQAHRAFDCLAELTRGWQTRKMTTPRNIVFLLTDAFGGFGGIAKFNRDFIQAIDKCSEVGRIFAFPRIIGQPIDDRIPEAVVYDRRAARGKISFLGRILSFAWRGPKPDLIICGHLNLLPAAWILSLLRGCRLCLVIHGIDAWEHRNWLVRAMLRSVVSVVSVSRYSAERFRGWSSVSQDRFFILPNCVDLSAFIPEPRNLLLAERYRIRDEKVLLTVGRMSSAERYKGFDEVLDALPELITRFPKLKYLIVGDGDDQARLQRKAFSLGISGNVVFAGRISEHEKVAHYCLADAYVMPSYGEGFGIVFLEALACGVPAIGSRVDGSREALLDGELGRLIDPAQREELVKAVTDVLLDGKRGERNSAVTTFDVPHFQSRVISWLESIGMDARN